MDGGRAVRRHLGIRCLCAVVAGVASVALGPVLAVPASATPTPPSDCQFVPGGLSGWWSGNGSATDNTGANNGTLVNGATYAPGKVGQAFHFDGVNDYVQVGAPASLKMGAAVTIAAWIRPTADVAGIIVNKEGEYEVSRFPDGTIQWAFANPTSWFGKSTWQWNNTHAVAPLNEWTHVVVVYDSTKVTTYVNGVMVNSVGGSVPSGNAATLGDVEPAQNDFRIGGRQGLSQFFTGDIDEVMVWNQPVSAADVTALASTGLDGERVQTRPTVRVDFDRLPDGTATTTGQTIDDEYASLGATFRLDGTGAPSIIANSTFPGGTRALSPTVDASLTPANMQDIVIDFSVPVARVSLASGSTDEVWALRAYAGDTLVASGSPVAHGSTAVATAVASAPTTTGWITRAVVDLTQATTTASGPEYYDLLEFDVADDTAPIASATATPSPNGAGWNNGPVTVTLFATDAGGSGLHDLSYAATGATTIATTEDTDGQATLVIPDDGTTTISYGARDCQGNAVSGSDTVLVDQTAPVVTYNGNAGTYTVADDVSITCTASDATSGVASDSCEDVSGPAWSFGLGTHSFIATATDVAGNQTTASMTFVVSVDPTSLCTVTEELASDAGAARSLCEKLAGASTAPTPQARAGKIRAYRNELAAKSGKAFTTSETTLLDTLAASL